MAAKTLMVVDDQKHVLRAIERVLKKQGYTIQCFTSPIEALDSIADIKPKVILSDRRMPHMEGLDFLIRAKEIYHQCYCILMTGYPHIPESVQNALEDGRIDLVVQKPIDDDQLVSQIKKAFETGP